MGMTFAVRHNTTTNNSNIMHDTVK